MDTTEKSPAVLSLCTGIRGLERGIERALGAKLRTVAYAEIEAFIDTNLIAGMEAGVLDPTPIWTNIKTFPWEQFHGKVHGIIGGYPCQPFSNAGKRSGEEDPRHLWPYIAKGIRTVRPLWCFFENVPGHLTLGYETVRGELQEMGYRVEEGIFSAEEVGAPHQRKRLFILAVLYDPRLFGSEKRQEQTAGFKQPSKKLLDKAYRTSTRNEISTRGKSVSVSGIAELANSKSKLCELASSAWQRGSGFANSSEAKLAITNIIRCFHKPFTIDTTKRRFNALRDIAASGNEETYNMDRWPARPGREQYDWEEPRTSLSGLGITINGYNFREDLLRAAGNAVVEQTAELAWMTLWNKMNQT